MLFSILGAISGLGGLISSITGQIRDYQVAKAKADTDKEKMKYDQQIQEAQARKAVLVAEAGNRVAGAINASARFTLAMSAAILLMKITVWDKVIGSLRGCAGDGAANLPDCIIYRTDPLDSNVWWFLIAVIGFYFLYDIAARSRRNP